MIDYKSIALKYSPAINEKLGFVQSLLIKTLQIIAPQNKLTLKLKFYQAFFNYIKLLGYYIVQKNGISFSLINLHTAKDIRILVDLLYHFGLIVKDNNHYQFAPNIQSVSGEDVAAIIAIIENEEHYQLGNKELQKCLVDFSFVKELIKKYRNPNYQFKLSKSQKAWTKILRNGNLDYEVRLSETLFELCHFVPGKKIDSPFDENYYTESGRNAFKNFTRPQFLSVLNQLGMQKQATNVLDIGCGYGDYIDVVIQWNNNAKVSGVELQENVFSDVNERFASNSSIEIFNENIFEFKTDKKFDIVLLNYVLFYFSKEDKKKLFEKIHSLLSANGVILICQYYAGIESIKYELTRKQGDSSLTKKIELFIGNKIVYANALWNQTASTFAEAEDWTTFVSMLNKLSFEVDAITNADRFYYSIFVKVHPIRSANRQVGVV